MQMQMQNRSTRIRSKLKRKTMLMMSARMKKTMVLKMMKMMKMKMNMIKMENRISLQSAVAPAAWPWLLRSPAHIKRKKRRKIDHEKETLEIEQNNGTSGFHEFKESNSHSLFTQKCT
jgi:hypothetical protein